MGTTSSRPAELDYLSSQPTDHLVSIGNWLSNADQNSFLRLCTRTRRLPLLLHGRITIPRVPVGTRRICLQGRYRFHHSTGHLPIPSSIQSLQFEVNFGESIPLSFSSYVHLTELCVTGMSSDLLHLEKLPHLTALETDYVCPPGLQLLRARINYPQTGLNLPASLTDLTLQLLRSPPPLPVHLRKLTLRGHPVETFQLPPQLEYLSTDCAFFLTDPPLRSLRSLRSETVNPVSRLSDITPHLEELVVNSLMSCTLPPLLRLLSIVGGTRELDPEPLILKSASLRSLTIAGRSFLTINLVECTSLSKLQCQGRGGIKLSFPPCLRHLDLDGHRLQYDVYPVHLKFYRGIYPSSAWGLTELTHLDLLDCDGPPRLPASLVYLADRTGKYPLVCPPLLRHLCLHAKSRISELASSIRSVSGPSSVLDRLELTPTVWRIYT